MSSLEVFSDLILDLLRYYQHGNDTSLKAIFDKALKHSVWNHENSKFWYFNSRLALEIGGFLEVVETMGGSRWSFVSNKPAIKKRQRVVLLGTKKSLSNNTDKNRIDPIITTSEGFLLYGVCQDGQGINSEAGDIVELTGRIISHFPSFDEVENSVADFVRGSPDFSISKWESYDFSNLKWVDVNSTEHANRGLFRTWDVRLGRSYWIHDGSIKSLRIFYPEWANLLAAKRLKIKLDDVLTYQHGTVVVPRTFRLPRLLIKELFINSEQLHIDWNLSFAGVPESTYSTLIDILKKKGFSL